MFIIRQIFPHNLQKRRQDLEDANSWLAKAETLPKLVLIFLLLVLPFLVDNTPFTEWANLLWWVKGWMPVWVGVLALLYFSIGLVTGPRQLTGASIEAIAQASDEQELVPAPQPVEMPCPFPPPASESNNQEVRAVTTTLWQQLRCRITKLQLHHFPSLRFIPPAFSRDSLA
ncbi:MAG: hypothetical protein IT327_15100 [Anaerolineae bacterium]|nr:hypothetical protein [Anaerolineae bacterium]